MSAEQFGEPKDTLGKSLGRLGQSPAEFTHSTLYSLLKDRVDQALDYPPLGDEMRGLLRDSLRDSPLLGWRLTLALSPEG